MIMSDDKKRVAAIMGEMPDVSEAPESNESDDGLDTAAQEAMDAAKSGDVQAFKEALKSFVSMCMDSDSEEYSE